MNRWQVSEGTGCCWGALCRILVFFVCFCFKSVKLSEGSFPATADAQNARVFTSISLRVLGPRLLGRHTGRFCAVIYSSTKGRGFLSPEVRHFVTGFRAELLLSVSTSISSRDSDCNFLKCGVSYKELARTTREDVNVSILHWACVVACVVRVENALLMNCLVF
jgi:hypothetical protein